MNLNATLIGQTISFILFVFFCMKYIWPPIIQNINYRQKKIRSGLIFSNQAKLDLIFAKIEAQKEITEAKKIAKNILQDAYDRKYSILKTAKILATKESNNLLDKAKFEIKLHYKKSFEKLITEIENLSITLAEKIIKKSVKKSEYKTTIKMFLSRFNK